jgi:HEAT repeat protein
VLQLRTAFTLLLLSVAFVSAPAARQTPKPVADAQAPVTGEQVLAAIDTLGSIDFPVRSASGRTIRRADPAIAVPALLQAVKQHKDEYVRFRALVILSGFNDPRTRDVMAAAISDKNDRLRTVAYGYFERNPDVKIAPRLLEALKVEESEFVRPALTRDSRHTPTIPRSAKPWKAWS